MTHNCNGLLTRVGERHKEELRMDLVLRFAKKNRVPVIAIQEPHINSSQKLEFATKRFKKKGYSLISPITPEGRGGAGIAYSDDFALVSTKFFSDRLCFASLKSGDGEVFNFLSVHMHHRGPTRSAQWRSLLTDPEFAIPPSTFVLGDFNSVIIPSRDIAFTNPNSPDTPSSSAADGARNLEVEFIRKWELQDSYAVTHHERSKDHELGGYTWGFPPADPARRACAEPNPKRHCNSIETSPQTDKRRRLDRILIPSVFSTNLEGCYPTFLAFSDHKAVVVSLAPRLFSPKNKRPFVPTSFLTDTPTVDSLKKEISALTSGGLDWWGQAQSLIRNRAVDFHRGANPHGCSELTACILSSSSSSVSSQGWDYLAERGLQPATPSQAYSMLCALGDKENSDRSGLKVFEHLKEALLDPTEELPGARKKKSGDLLNNCKIRGSYRD